MNRGGHSVAWIVFDPFDAWKLERVSRGDIGSRVDAGPPWYQDGWAYLRL